MKQQTQELIPLIPLFEIPMNTTNHPAAYYALVCGVAFATKQFSNQYT